MERWQLRLFEFVLSIAGLLVVAYFAWMLVPSP